MVHAETQKPHIQITSSIAKKGTLQHIHLKSLSTHIYLFFGSVTCLLLQRITVAEILENEWFQIDYEPSTGTGHENFINLDDVDATFDESTGVRN